MKLNRILIGWFVLLALASCHDPVETRRATSLQPEVSPELLYIDSLMWYHPDSALMHLIYYFKPDSATITLSTRTECNQRYAHLLLSELLFKNGYPQTNRENLLWSVDYFDSLTMVKMHGTDTRGVSLQTESDCRNASNASAQNISPNNVFLSARAHYMNGVGYQEHDSIIEAYNEYIRALEIMETHFPIVETLRATSQNTTSKKTLHATSLHIIPHLPRFMMLIHCRLGGLFSDQFMQEPAIYCFKKALAFNRLEPIFPDDYSNSLYFIGLQYDKLQQWDSAQYYYDEALRLLPDTSNWLFKVLISSKANLNYVSSEEVEPAVSDLKRIAAQTDSCDKPRYFFLIGQIYYDANQYDSALVYLVPTFEQSKGVATKTLTAKFLHDIYQNRGDTLKAVQYAVYHAENTEQERVMMARVSYLNDLFQNHLRKEQETYLLRQRQNNIKKLLIIALPLAAILVAFVAIIIRRRSKKRLAIQEAEKQRQLSEFHQKHDAVERELQSKIAQSAAHTREVLQQRAMTIYQSGSENRLKQILAEFEAVYPKALSELAVAHPELSKTERHIAVLNFLRFRSKEEAELMGFTEYTALKYRSNLKKKAGSDPISTLFEAGKI